MSGFGGKSGIGIFLTKMGGRIAGGGGGLNTNPPPSSPSQREGGSSGATISSWVGRGLGVGGCGGVVLEIAPPVGSAPPWKTLGVFLDSTLSVEEGGVGGAPNP